MAARRILSTLALALSLTGSQAQTAAPYTDEATGITFSQVTQANGMTFGFALPQTGNDFIGRIEAPVAPGWAGFSTQSSMTAGLLVVAWPNGDNVIGSLRKAVSFPVAEDFGVFELHVHGSFKTSKEHLISYYHSRMLI